MAILQRPGAEHVYEYIEYPAMRYNASGENRTINSEAEEAEGWYNNPGQALREAAELRQKEAEKNAREVAAARKARAKEEAALKELAGTDGNEPPPAIPPEKTAELPTGNEPPQPRENEGTDGPVEIPTLTELGRMNHEQLESLAHKLGCVHPEDPKAYSKRELKAMINSKREQ